MKSLRTIFLCIVMIGCTACGNSTYDLAVTMVAQTMEARATGTARMDEAFSLALTQMANEGAPTPTATPTFESILEATPTPEVTLTLPPIPSPTPSLGPETVKISVENAPAVTELFRFGDGIFYCVDAHPTEAILAVCRGDDVWIYDAATLEVITKLTGHARWVMDAEWSPDGGQLVSSSGDGQIRIWDAETYQEVLVIDAHDGAIPDVDWKPDGSLLASASHDTTAAVWDAVTGERKISIEGHQNEVSNVYWHQSGEYHFGQLHTASLGRFYRWDPETNIISDPGNMARDPADIAECYRGGATGFYDGEIRINFDDPEKSGPDWYDGNYFLSDPVYALDWNSSCDTLAFGSYETLQLWSHETTDVSLVINREPAYITDLSWLAGDTQIATVGENFLAIYDAKTGEIVREVKDDSSWFRQVEWSPDGKYMAATAGTDGTTRVWDFETRELVQSLQIPNGHQVNIWAVSWSPDGSRLATCNTDAMDPTIRIWDTETWDELHLLEGHTEGVRDIIWSPDGKQLISSGKDQVIRIWDAQSGEKLSIIPSANYINQLDWSPGGVLFASANGDGTVRFWDPVTARQTSYISAHGRGTAAVEYSPDGTLIASGSGDGNIKIWDAVTREEILLLEGNHAVWTTAWSPDGNLLLSVNTYGDVRLWDVSSGELLYEMKGFSGTRFGAWSPDGRYFAVAGTGMVHIYGVTPAGE